MEKQEIDTKKPSTPSGSGAISISTRPGQEGFSQNDKTLLKKAGFNDHEIPLAETFFSSFYWNDDTKSWEKFKE